MNAYSRTRLSASVWLSRAVIAGFVATGVMTIALVAAYYVADAFGTSSGELLGKWLWGLTHNPVVSTSQSLIYLAIGIHLVVGLAFAVIYARFLEPVLQGPAWTRGARFALLPGVLSLVVLLPMLGGGFFGASLDAGPLPIIGNLTLHLVYGVVLGWTYGLSTSWQEDQAYPVDQTATRTPERSLAVGIVVGALVGGLAGWVIGMALISADGPVPVLMTAAASALAGALAGSALGAIIGPIFGLTPRE